MKVLRNVLAASLFHYASPAAVMQMTGALYGDKYT